MPARGVVGGFFKKNAQIQGVVGVVFKKNTQIQGVVGDGFQKSTTKAARCAFHYKRQRASQP